jgi:hypothetical protein
MTQDHPSPTAPPFTAGSITFRCWIIDGGHRLEWRSADGELRVGRNVGKATHWAMAADRPAGHAHRSLKAAMLAAVDADERVHRRAA